MAELVVDPLQDDWAFVDGELAIAVRPFDGPAVGYFKVGELDG